MTRIFMIAVAAVPLVQLCEGWLMEFTCHAIGRMCQ
jgi:hypothetical protein